MTQYARPVADITVGSWTTTPLWDKVDEVTPDDATTVIQTPTGPSNLTAEVRFGSVSDPLQSIGHIARVRAYTTGNCTLAWSIYQGTTLIANCGTITLTGSYSTYTYTLTVAQANAITNYADLRVRFTGNGSSGRVRVTWFELEVPDVLIQRSGTATVTGGRDVTSTVKKAALVLAAIGILGHVLSTGFKSYPVILHGGGALAVSVMKSVSVNLGKYERILFADDFNRPDESPLDPAKWGQRNNPAQVVSQQGRGNANGNPGIQYALGVDITDGWVEELLVSGGGTDIFLAARGISYTPLYMAHVRGDLYVDLWYKDFPINQPGSSVMTPSTLGKKLKFTFEGQNPTRLRAYLDGLVVLDFTHVNDGSNPSGYVGFCHRYPGETFDDFRAGDFGQNYAVIGGGFLAATQKKEVQGAATISGKGNIFIWSEDKYGSLAIAGNGATTATGSKGGASPFKAYDDFERADGSVGPNWVDVSGQPPLVIESGAIVSQTGEWRIGLWAKHDWNPDQSVSVIYKTSPAIRGGAVLRGTASSGRGYAVGLMQNTSYAQWSIFTSTGPGGFGWTWSSGGYPVVNPGDVVTYQVTGYDPTISCYVNGSYRWSYSPSGILRLSTGWPGAYVTNFGAIDEWFGVLNAPISLKISCGGAVAGSGEKGGVAEGRITATYSDDFNRPDGSFGNGWVVHPNWYFPQIENQRVSIPVNRYGYIEHVLWQDKPVCDDADIEFTHIVDPWDPYSRPWYVVFQGGCGGVGEWISGGYGVGYGNPAVSRWNLREIGSGGGWDNTWWSGITANLPQNARVRVEKRGNVYSVYVNGTLQTTLTDPLKRYFGQKGYVGFVGDSCTNGVKLDDFSVTMYLTQTGSVIKAGDAGTRTGRKGARVCASIPGGGAMSASAREDARYPASISGGGVVNLSVRKNARKGCSISERGATTAGGLKGAKSSFTVTGGGRVIGAGNSEFVDTASVFAIIHGGGALHATGECGRVGDAYLFGGGNLDVVYDRAWPYLPIGQIENPDATCHLVKMEMDYCSRTFGVAPCIATGTPCYNTWKTCRYISAYLPIKRTYSYVSAEYPQALPLTRPYVDDLKYMATEIKTNLTVNARVSFTMIDEPDADVDTDPYWMQRSSHPGTYWKRWLARNVNYKGRIVRIFDGPYGKPESSYVQKWVGKLENIKIKGDRISFEAVDLLKDLTKIEVPGKTNAKLSLALSATGGSTFTITEDTDKFPPSGYVRIQDEIIRYTSVNVTTKTFTFGGGANRGQFGTTAVAHPVKEKVQGVRYYAPKNPVEILLDMLLGDAGMKDSWTDDVSAVSRAALSAAATYIDLDAAQTNSWPAAGVLRLISGGAAEFVRTTSKTYRPGTTPVNRFTFDSYNSVVSGRGLFLTNAISGASGAVTAYRGAFEYVDTDAFYLYRDWPLRDIDFTSVVSEPTKLSDLFFEIVDLIDAKAWVAENLKITLRKNTVNTPTTGYLSFSDADNIIEGSGSLDVNEKSRISRMTIYWDKVATDKFSDEMSYRRLDIAIDPDAETNYGDHEEKVVKCRWIDPFVTLEESVQAFVKNLAIRRIQRCKHAQHLVTIKVAEKDSGVKTGDYVRLSTDELLEPSGLPITSRMYQAVKRERAQQEVNLTLIQVSPRRMAVIAPAGLPAFPSATESQRAHGYIADATGRMSDGSDGYYIW